jgi:alpha-glucosidase
MQGGGDPLCRGCFPWDRDQWEVELLEWTRRCIRLRQDHPALRAGRYRSLRARSTIMVFAFARWNERERLVVALNNRAVPGTLDLPLAGAPIPSNSEMYDLLSGEVYHVRAGRVEGVRIPRRGGVVLHQFVE